MQRIIATLTLFLVCYSVFVQAEISNAPPWWCKGIPRAPIHFSPHTLLCALYLPQGKEIVLCSHVFSKKSKNKIFSRIGFKKKSGARFCVEECVPCPEARLLVSRESCLWLIAFGFQALQDFTLSIPTEDFTSDALSCLSICRNSSPDGRHS